MAEPLHVVDPDFDDADAYVDGIDRDDPATIERANVIEAAVLRVSNNTVHTLYVDIPSRHPEWSRLMRALAINTSVETLFLRRAVAPERWGVGRNADAAAPATVCDAVSRNGAIYRITFTDTGATDADVTAVLEQMARRHSLSVFVTRELNVSQQWWRTLFDTEIERLRVRSVAMEVLALEVATARSLLNAVAHNPWLHTLELHSVLFPRSNSVWDLAEQAFRGTTHLRQFVWARNHDFDPDSLGHMMLASILVGLERNVSVRCLSVYDTEFVSTYPHANLLSGVIRDNAAIERMVVNGGAMAYRSMARLASALSQNTRLVTLDLRNQPHIPATLAAFSNALGFAVGPLPADARINTTLLHFPIDRYESPVVRNGAADFDPEVARRPTPDVMRLVLEFERNLRQRQHSRVLQLGMPQMMGVGAPLPANLLAMTAGFLAEVPRGPPEAAEVARANLTQADVDADLQRRRAAMDARPQRA